MKTPIGIGVNQLHTWIRKHQRASEAALAMTFAQQEGDWWRYNTDEGVWLQWVKTHWARRQTPELFDTLKEFLVRFTNALQKVAIITHTEALKLQSQRAISAIERICRSLPSFLMRSSAFDADPFLLGTPDGTIDLRTGETWEPDPADHITVLATARAAPCGTPAPRWSKFLDDITEGDKDLQKTLQQWAGISASGTSRDQRIMFIYGQGGNGKGVFLRTISGLLGLHAVNAPRDLLMVQRNSQHPTALVDVINARMAMATEVDEDATWDTALVKDLTGGDLIAARRMRQDFFHAEAHCSITISGNRKPTLKGVDEAVKRRFLVTTFKLKVAPDQVIPDLEKVFIREEGPAILRWIIDGAVAREREGRLHVAGVIAEDTADYFAEENVLEDFIGKYFERADDGIDEHNQNFWVPTSDAFLAWRAYCGQIGRAPGARNQFTTAMKNASIGYKRTENGRFFTRIRMLVSQY